MSITFVSEKITRAAPGPRRHFPERRVPLAMAAVVFAVAFAGSAEAGSDTPTIGELKQLNVEDLMNVEVTSVSRHPQRLLAAASAIQVITQEDISPLRRHQHSTGACRMSTAVKWPLRSRQCP
jgi:hypothetical protein